MAQNYIYFAGTLPMLFFGEKPALSIETFDGDAARLTSAKTAALLKKATLYNLEATELPSAVRKYYAWENALRNSWLEFRKKFRSDAGDFKRNNPDY